MRESGFNVAERPNGLGEDAARAVGIGGHARRDGLERLARELGDARDDIRAEARRQLRARHLHHLADMVEAQLVQRDGLLGGKTQGGGGQKLGHRPRGLGIRRVAFGAEAREGPGSTRRGCGGRPRAIAEAVQARDDFFAQGVFAAEQMGAAGDVEEQPVVAVHRGPWRVAAAPIGQKRQFELVACRVRRNGTQSFAPGVGVV